MPGAKFLEGAPEGTVFDNTTAALIEKGWSVERVQTGNDRRVGLVLATPDHLRLLEPDELVGALHLRMEDDFLVPGFDADFDNSQDRGYLLYRGKFDIEVVMALAQVAALTDSKPE